MNARELKEQLRNDLIEAVTDLAEHRGLPTSWSTIRNLYPDMKMTAKRLEVRLGTVRGLCEMEVREASEKQMKVITKMGRRAEFADLKELKGKPLNICQASALISRCVEIEHLEMDEYTTAEEMTRAEEGLESLIEFIKNN